MNAANRLSGQQRTRGRTGVAMLLLVCSLIGAGRASSAVGQGQRATGDAPHSTPAAPVAATVDGVAIYVGEVQRRVQRALGDRAAEEGALPRLQAETLEQLIKEQTVLGALEQRGEVCNAQQLNLAVSRLKDALSRQDKSLEEYCQSQGLTVAALERAMRWQMSWSAYLEKSLTDENLQRYFAEHRAHFDGTRMRVAQILLTWPDDPAARAGVAQRAAALRAEIVAGSLTFAEAARKFSESPSAREGGLLDWISRHEPMPEFFGQAAFELEAGDISPPITSLLGVHLIQCVEIEPGTKAWQDAREALAAAMPAYLFEWNLTHRKTPPQVTFTGAVPYYQPGTRTLVVPEQSNAAATKRTGK